MNATSGFAPVEGASLYYESVGNGPAVVLVHGRALDHGMWTRNVPAFAPRYRVVTCDLRGCGRSPAGDVPYAHADDLRALLDHLAIECAALVGCSMGGGAAINFAVQWPERLWALVVVGSSLGGHAWSPEMATVLAEMKRREATEGRAAANRWFVSTARFDAAPAREAAPAAEQPAPPAAERPAAPPRAPKPDLGRPLVPPAIERLAAISAPTLALVGERDLPDMHAIADTVAARVPHARKQVLEGLGHLPSLESPERFDAVLGEFLASVAP